MMLDSSGFGYQLTVCMSASGTGNTSLVSSRVVVIIYE